MKLNRKYSILLLTALLHLLADTAFAGGSVLCVGPNDHAAVEAGQLARDCGPAVGADVLADDLGPVSDLGAGSDCTDIPLHSDAEMVSEDSAWDPQFPVALVAPNSWQAQPLLTRGRDLRIRPGTDLAPTMRVHRSIVLIL